MAGCGSRLLVSIYFFSPHYISNISSTPYHDMRRRSRAGVDKFTPHAPRAIFDSGETGRKRGQVYVRDPDSPWPKHPLLHTAHARWISNRCQLASTGPFPSCPLFSHAGRNLPVASWSGGLLVRWSGGSPGSQSAVLI
jgi:uncharacterized protein (DUF1684 family)